VTLEPTGIVEASAKNADRWQSFTWRGGLEYQATPDLMLYGAVAKGYKAGGFNVRLNSNLPNLGLAAFEPETAVLYEIGARSEWFNRRLRLNATLFHTSYRDIQLRRQAIVDGVSATLIENAARARIQGAELELVAKPMKAMTLSAGYGHLAPKYLDPGGVPEITRSSRFQRTVSHSFAGSLQYVFPVRVGTIELTSNISYRSKEQFQLAARPYDQDGYVLIGARAQFRALHDRWSVAFLVNNLADRHYRTAGRGVAALDGVSFSSVGMPRRFGIELAATF
jgi:iron complex outermembrane receptor protein